MGKKAFVNEDSTVAGGKALAKSSESTDAADDSVAKGPSTESKVPEAGVIKDEVVPKNAYNTKKAAELVGNGSASTVGVGGAMFAASRQVTYSGSGDLISGDKSSNLVSTKSRKSGDRPGRMLDTALARIDDAPAEVYRVPISTIPMLNEGASNVGYNGVYRNAHAISQKGAGATPADSDFFRTLDVIEYDQIYFGDGQYVFSSAESNPGRLTITDFDIEDGESSQRNIQLGNYLYDHCTLTINSSGIVTKLEFGVKDIKPDAVSETCLRVANDNALRSDNIIELDRLAMIDKAGDETKENWSCLGKVITHSKDTNRFLKEFDLSIGDMAALSQMKLQCGLSYQNNKAAKDGIRRVGPMFEMCRGNMNSYQGYRFTTHDENTSGLFSKAAMKGGSAELYIAMNDSTPKYNTKGKMLSLPLSFKTALSTARQNSGSLRMHDKFLSEFKRQEVFGKIDEDGSGISPYFLSDGAKVATTINLNEGIDNSGSATVVSNSCIIHYEDIRNVYNIPVYNYFAAGLLDYFNRFGHKIFDLCSSSGDSSVTITIPMTSTVECLSLWDLFVCAAMKDIAAHRKYAYDIVLDYEVKNGVYPYSGSVQLKDAALDSMGGFTFADITEPLRPSAVPLNVAVRLLLPETFNLLGYIDHGGTGSSNEVAGKVVLPWYFSQNQFTVVPSDDDGSKWAESAGDMSNNTYFDFRGGVSFGNADRIRQLDPEQLRLCMDRMVTLPAQSKMIDDDEKYVAEVYKFSNHEDGIPVVNYGVRKGTSLPSSDDSFSVSVLDIVKTPRELGLSMIAPAGVVTPTYTYGTWVGAYVGWNHPFFAVSGPSFRCRFWYSASSIVSDLFSSSDTVTRLAATNYTAHYKVFEATPIYGVSDVNVRNEIGITLYANRKAGNGTYTEYMIPLKQVSASPEYDPNTGSYSGTETVIVPGTTDGYASAFTGWISALKSLYARLQFLPFVVNPFDANLYMVTGSESNNTWYATNEVDQYDFLHLFNMCGFRAGEYSMTEFERNKARIEQGLNYVSDPYMERRS